MIVFGIISPHPPIIIPSIGHEEIKKVVHTTSALEHAAVSLGQASPDELIIISPHEGHGFQVPIYYLAAHLPQDIPVQEIFVAHDSYQYYYDFGRREGARLALEDKRYAVIASGDLSHVLAASGPYGYDPAGAVLDEIIIKAVSVRDAGTLLSIDPTVLSQGAECGLRSILFLLGAMEGIDLAANVLSYEGPFGVGYLVATYQQQVAK